LQKKTDCSTHARATDQRAIRKRRKAKTTDSTQRTLLAPNLLKRDFEADAPNTKWMTDMTYIATHEG
jgi:transposase InsO family protein